MYKHLELLKYPLHCYHKTIAYDVNEELTVEFCPVEGSESFKQALMLVMVVY